MRAHQLDGLRCGSMLREPGGLKERIVHAWSHKGRELAVVEPKQQACDGDDVVFVSEFPVADKPNDPTGKWACTTLTVGGQLVGVRKFEVLTKDGASIESTPPGDAGVTDPPPPIDAGATAKPDAGAIANPDAGAASRDAR
jgi:hypothetical protein